MAAGDEEIPSWLLYTEAELAETIAATSKQRPNQAKELAAMAGLLPKARPCCPALPTALNNHYWPFISHLIVFKASLASSTDVQQVAEQVYMYMTAARCSRKSLL